MGNRSTTDESSGTSRPAIQKLGALVRQIWSGLSLSQVQAIVAVLTGIVTITVGLHSLAHYSEPGPNMGDLVAFVQDAVSQKGVPDATIEIMTSQNALVATLTPDSSGQARQSLKEGIYTVHVSHPRYAPEVRQIQVFPQQTVAIKAALRAPGSPVEHAKRTVNDGVHAVKRAFGF
jgi:hypothetical protein